MTGVNYFSIHGLFVARQSVGWLVHMIMLKYVESRHLHTVHVCYFAFAEFAVMKLSIL